MMYLIEGEQVDSVELKCLVVSRGVKVDKAVYKQYAQVSRLDINPLCCNVMLLRDGTIVQLTDTGFHLKYLSGILSWNTLKLLKYASELSTPFSLRLLDGQVALFHKQEFVDYVRFLSYTDFYHQKTSRGTPFMGNAVLQGSDWVSFQCLWPCEFAASGKSCEFCFSGAEFEARAKKGKPLGDALSAKDFMDIVTYAAVNDGVSAMQLTGGSTFEAQKENLYIMKYLESLQKSSVFLDEVFLYITPPKNLSFIDDYFELGATRIACSIEVWDLELAAKITPGKIDYSTRNGYLRALNFIAEKYGPGRAYSNFIIGIESFESLRFGAIYLAERGIIPSASVWMPMGRPVMGSMKAPELDYYRRVKELFSEIYIKFNLRPIDHNGLNVCIERDIYQYALRGQEV
jgi:hypothetical protein